MSGCIYVDLPGVAESTDCRDVGEGTLRIGARQAGELVDVTVRIKSMESGKPGAKGRTYTSPKSNPKRFVLLPGRYRVGIVSEFELRGKRVKVMCVAPQDFFLTVKPNQKNEFSINISEADGWKLSEDD